MRASFALALILAAAPAMAQREPEWRTAPEYDVLLRPFAYEPPIIRVEADRPVVLRFVNGGRSTHGFRAPRFFRSARLRRGDEDLQLTGSFRLGPGEQRRIALVPVRGRYRVSSPNIVQSALGMRALIIVE
jgi:hypothetical protein